MSRPNSHDHRFRPAVAESLECRVTPAAPAHPAHLAAVVARQSIDRAAALPVLTQDTLRGVFRKIDADFSQYINGYGFRNNTGSYPTLVNQLNGALARLPYGPTRLGPQVRGSLNDMPLLNGEEGFFRDWVKYEVRQYVRNGVATGQFVVVPALPHVHSPAAPPRAGLPG